MSITPKPIPTKGLAPSPYLQHLDNGLANNGPRGNNAIPPGVYYLRQGNKKDKEHYLEPYVSKFKTPPKLYGKANKYVKRILDRYLKFQPEKSCGVIASGHSGTGKTTIAECVSNEIIARGFAVVMAVDIEATMETVHYISNLQNVVVFFDEFGKNFPTYLQDKMLTMLSSSSNGRKLFFITENNTYSISRFIINRTGRAWYHLDFARIDYDALLEFCKDKDVKDKMLEEVLNLYDTSTVFSHDHLQAIAEEHTNYPEESLEELLDILNLSIHRKAKTYSVIDVELVPDELPKEYNVRRDNINSGMGNINMGMGGTFGPPGTPPVIEPEPQTKLDKAIKAKKEKDKKDEKVEKVKPEYASLSVDKKALERGRSYFLRLTNIMGPSVRFGKKDIVLIERETGNVILLVNDAFQITLAPDVN